MSQVSPYAGSLAFLQEMDSGMAAARHQQALRQREQENQLANALRLMELERGMARDAEQTRQFDARLNLDTQIRGDSLRSLDDYRSEQIRLREEQRQQRAQQGLALAQLFGGMPGGAMDGGMGGGMGGGGGVPGGFGGGGMGGMGGMPIDPRAGMLTRPDNPGRYPGPQGGLPGNPGGDAGDLPSLARAAAASRIPLLQQLAQIDPAAALTEWRKLQDELREIDRRSAAAEYIRQNFANDPKALQAAAMHEQGIDGTLMRMVMGEAGTPQRMSPAELGPILDRVYGPHARPGIGEDVALLRQQGIPIGVGEANISGKVRPDRIREDPRFIVAQERFNLARQRHTALSAGDRLGMNIETKQAAADLERAAQEFLGIVDELGGVERPREVALTDTIKVGGEKKTLSEARLTPADLRRLWDQALDEFARRNGREAYDEDGEAVKRIHDELIAAGQRRRR